ncbi:potassium voltage-gated channel subfamily V member 2-like [Sceloporus undulatus]|uniref:potassium voltage-gated channel subfamily V member 2-like n=1 Tax=Sceloporus undulatus TaxID=8520 RepID=UPI001C4CD878|nr:potassium voltage-gated channel subfamily V member 2-like [Sceloporus undulatus]
MSTPRNKTMRQSMRRRSSLSANLKIGDYQKCCLTPQEEEVYIPFAQENLVKQWNSMHNVSDWSQEHCSGPSRRNRYFLNLNVGGKCFQIACKVAAKYPVTRIGQLALSTDPMKKLTLCDDYSVPKNEYFFDRDPLIFHYVYHFYRSGVMWVMEEMCPSNFVEEIEYWGIHMKYAQRCCRILFEEKQDELAEYLKVQRELEAELEPVEREEHFEGKFLGGFRKAVWNLIENPYSSIPAKVIAIMSSIFVLISIVGMTLSTVEEMQHKASKKCMQRLETICAIFFTLEYLMRLISTSTFRQFLRAAFSAIDLVAIMPFYIQLLFENLGEVESDYHEELHRMRSVGKLGKVLKLIKLMRIFRILKLARHSTGLRAFGFTIRQCYQQVCCLLLFIAMGVFTFSALMHSVEHDIPGTNFTSIPDAWWWAAVSLSTVGYGDTVPDTFLGRVVAFGCISFGIILNGMPISILYNKFSDYYAKLKSHEVQATSSLKLSRKLNLKERAWRKFTDTCCAEYAVPGRADPHLGGSTRHPAPSQLFPHQGYQPIHQGGHPVTHQPSHSIPHSPRAPLGHRLDHHDHHDHHDHPHIHLTTLSSYSPSSPYVFPTHSLQSFKKTESVSHSS